MGTPSFVGVFVPCITPFSEQGEVDIPSLERVLDFILQSPVSGVVVAGTTGEGLFLSMAEKELLYQTLIDYRRRSSKKFLIIQGTGTQTLNEALSAVEVGARLGVDAVLALPPRTNEQNEIIDYYSRLHRATSLPLIAYNIPRVSGCLIRPETFEELFSRDVIIGIKDSTKDIQLLYAWKKAARAAILFVGEDKLIQEGVSRAGANATIAGVANVYARDVVGVFQLAKQGGGESEQALLSEKVKAFSDTGNFIGGIKKKLKEMGIISSDFKRVK